MTPEQLEKFYAMAEPRSEESIRKAKERKKKHLIKYWFDHIKQMATDRKTLNGVVMEDAFCLDEIRALAHNASEFVERFWNDEDAWED